MSYQDYEVEISESQLGKVFSGIKGLCLLGGWAVYITVNKSFSQSQGRNYVGSRDIDLGFHVDPKWTESQLKNSLFATTVGLLEKMGFAPLNFRLVKYFHTETRKELSAQEARSTPQHLMFDHYIDPIVDNIHPKTKRVLGFVPIDEPLMSHVFSGGRYTTIEAFGGTFMLPKPEVLLATKIKPVPNRDKEHKRVKDVADIYALLWHSDEKPATLRAKLLRLISPDRVSSVVSNLNDQDYAAASVSTGVEKDEISRVIGELA